MSTDTISIGITAFNAEQSIAQAIESALAQDVPVSQILVVDDASSDGTVEIIEKYEAREPRIELIRHECNQGVAAARNKIIQHAQATFLAFFDDDDISSSDRVRLQRARIVAYEKEYALTSPVICHTARLQIYPEGVELVELAMGSGSGVAPHGMEVVFFTLMGKPLKSEHFGSCATCSQMARLETYRLLGGFDPAFRRGEDTELAIRHAIAGGHFVGECTPLVKQHMTPTSEKSLDKLHEFWIKIFEKHRDVFGSQAQYEFCKGWMDLKYSWLMGDRSCFVSTLVTLLSRYPGLTLQRAYRAIDGFRRNRVFSKFSKSINNQS